MAKIYYENLRLLNKPFETALKAKFDDFLESGWYILGKEVAALEEEFATYQQGQYAIGVSNGLEAISLALTCCGFKRGQEVIVPSNTFIATILSVVHCGLVPVLVEPQLGTYNIDPAKIKEAITPNTAAIIVVHLYGLPCDMDPIMDLVKEHDLKLIEDSAQAHGASYKGRMVGTFGDFGTFSFYPVKNLGALGDGGMVICKRKEDYIKLKQLRNYGSEKKYYNNIVGYNARLDELQAAFLRVKLEHLDEINNHKRKIAAIYHERLSTSKYILPYRHGDYHHVYHIFNIRHPERDKLKAYLLESGIETEIHYPLAPHRQQALAHLFEGADYPIADMIHRTTLSLPCSAIHGEEQILQVIEVLESFNG